jgi:polar amino acid transport system substrate-binding protein
MAMSFCSKYISRFLLIWAVLASSNVTAAEFKMISMDAVPWAYFDAKENRYSGIFPDLVREIEKHSGHDIKITLTSYARINRELETGRQDCTMLITEKKRGEITNLGELVFNIPMGVIPNKNTTLTRYEDLSGLTISVLRSLNITDKFTQDNELKKEFDTGYEIGLRKMLHGRLDAIAGTIPTIKYLAKEKGMGELLGKPLLLRFNPIYLQCSKKSKNKQLISDINSAMKSIRESQVLNDVVSKYWELQ